MVLPEVAPVVVAGAAAVPMSLPAVAGVVSSAVLAPDAAPPAGEETATVGVIFLTDTGSELPVESLEYMRITQDWLSVDVDEVLLEVSPVMSARAAALPFLPGGGGLLMMQPLWPM